MTKIFTFTDRVRSFVQHSASSYRTKKNSSANIPDLTVTFFSQAVPADAVPVIEIAALLVPFDLLTGSPDEAELYTAVIMGKSNRFDFTNRKNAGVSLGQVIGKAFELEAERTRKDAEKLTLKSRKQSISDSSELPEPITHRLDFKAPSKDLGDAGLCALADGLEMALRSGTNEASIALEDLNLSGNSLTAAALARLAPIIQLAKHELKTVNLANNAIKVQSAEEAAQWEVFLRSFAECFVLRRVDLGGNPHLGRRAMEIFARVHTNEAPITPLPPGGRGSVLSLVSESGDHQSDGAKAAPDTSNTLPYDRLAGGQMLQRRCGLRSIPYITLNGTGIDDASALWLSFVLEDHHYPTQLTDELNATLPSSSIKTYQQGTGSGGIEWDQNQPALGRDGLYLLHKTESLRRQFMLDDQSTCPGSAGMDDDMDGSTEDLLPNVKPGERNYSRGAPGNRRVSIRSVHTNDGGEHEASELESARKRIQRHVIDHDCATSVELWSAALQMVRCSRTLLWAAPQRRRFYIGEAILGSFVSTGKTSTASGMATRRAQNKLTVDTSLTIKTKQPNRGSYAAKVTASGKEKLGEPEVVITEVTNTPTTPRMVFKSRKGAFSEGTDLPAVTKKLSMLVINPERYIKYQKDRIAAAESPYRNTSIACHLPRHLVDHIFGYFASAREENVLSGEQRDAAFAWGQDRENLRIEQEWMRRDESSQVWMLLDSVKALAYEN